MAGPCVGARPRDDEGGARARARRAPQAEATEARAALLTLNRRASLSGERGAAPCLFWPIWSPGPVRGPATARDWRDRRDRRVVCARLARPARPACGVVWSLQVGGPLSGSFV